MHWNMPGVPRPPTAVQRHTGRGPHHVGRVRQLQQRHGGVEARQGLALLRALPRHQGQVAGAAVHAGVHDHLVPGDSCGGAKGNRTLWGSGVRCEGPCHTPHTRQYGLRTLGLLHLLQAAVHYIWAPSCWPLRMHACARHVPPYSFMLVPGPGLWGMKKRHRTTHRTCQPRLGPAVRPLKGVPHRARGGAGGQQLHAPAVAHHPPDLRWFQQSAMGSEMG